MEERKLVEVDLSYVGTSFVLEALRSELNKLKAERIEVDEMALRVVPPELCIAYCGNAEQYISAAFQTLQNDLSRMKEERRRTIEFSEQWMANPNKGKPETFTEWSQWMDGWNELKRLSIENAQEIERLKKLIQSSQSPPQTYREPSTLPPAQEP